MKIFYNKLNIAFILSISNTLLTLASADLAERVIKDSIVKGINFVSKAAKCTIFSKPLRYVKPGTKGAAALFSQNYGLSFYNKSKKDNVTIKVEEPGKFFGFNEIAKLEVPKGEIANIALDITKISDSKPLKLTVIDTAINRKAIYKFTEPKTIYVTWQPDRTPSAWDIFRKGGRPVGDLYPQSGPGGGYAGYTDNCFDKSNNIKIVPLGENEPLKK